ncbi:MAG: hypothetical protein U5N85_20250 [Arcicella sp.]|nr:hypothetical protein [Arcicella sp.]
MDETDSIELMNNFPNWLDKNSDIHFEYLQKSNRINEEELDYQPVTFKDKISGYLMMGLIVFLFAMMVYGFATFVSLFFKN